VATRSCSCRRTITGKSARIAAATAGISEAEPGAIMPSSCRTLLVSATVAKVTPVALATTESGTSSNSASTCATATPSAGRPARRRCTRACNAAGTEPWDVAAARDAAIAAIPRDAVRISSIVASSGSARPASATTAATPAASNGPSWSTVPAAATTWSRSASSAARTIGRRAISIAWPTRAAAVRARQLDGCPW